MMILQEGLAGGRQVAGARDRGTGLNLVEVRERMMQRGKRTDWMKTAEEEERELPSRKSKKRPRFRDKLRNMMQSMLMKKTAVCVSVTNEGQGRERTGRDSPDNLSETWQRP
jgi:hypothetical protein